MKKKIQPQDQVERELMAAMESFEGGQEEQPAEEAFPNGLKDWLGKKHIKQEWDSQAGEYKTVPKKMKIKEALKDFAQKLNMQLGIPCDKIDFEKYDLGATQLDSFPKGGITFIQHESGLDDSEWGPFYFYDGRTTVDKDKEGRFSQGRLYRERDKKTVRIHRVPAGQLLRQSSNIWFIPEEDLAALGSTQELRAKRVESKKGHQERLSQTRLKNLSSWQRESYDASGYLIDHRALERRLTKYKASKRVGKFDEVLEKYKRNVEDFNAMTKEILDGASIIFHRAFDSDSSIDETLSEFLKNAKRLKRYLEQDAPQFEKYQKEIAETGTISSSHDDDYYWGGNSSQYLDLTKRTNAGLKGYYYGSDYLKNYERLIGILDEYGPAGQGEEE